MTTGKRISRGVLAKVEVAMRDSWKRWLPAAVLGLVILFQGAVAQARDTLPRKLGALTYSHTIGNADSFGEVTAASLFGDDRVAVLDAFDSRVSVYGPNGDSLSSFGRKGAGPGELFKPVTIGESAVQELAVLDRGNLRLTYLRTSRDSLGHGGSLRIPISIPRDFCFVGNRLFLLGLNQENLIHEVDGSGTIVNSFGSSAPHDPTQGSISSIGLLACSSEAVAAASEISGYLQVFSTDGVPRWEGFIDGFVAQQYETEGGGFKPVPSREGYKHKVATLHWLPNGSLFLQLRRSDESEAPLLKGRLLDDSGEWEAAAPEWPPLLDRRGPLFLFREVAPFPLVKVYRER